MGHLEVKGFEMHNGIIMNTVKKKQCLKDLKKFCLVTFTKSQMTDRYTI